MKDPSTDAFVLWIDRTGPGLTGLVENVANSSRRRFDDLEELGRLLTDALAESTSLDEAKADDR